MEQTVSAVNNQLNTMMVKEKIVDVGLDPSHFHTCYNRNFENVNRVREEEIKDYRRFQVNLYYSPVNKMSSRSRIVQDIESILNRSVIYPEKKKKEEKQQPSFNYQQQNIDSNNNDGDNTCKNIDYCEVNELSMTEYIQLKNDRDFECMKLSEVSNVLRGLYKASPYGFWREKLLAERILLESGKAVELMLGKIRENVEYCSTKDLARGTVKISGLKFHLTDDFKPKPNQTDFYIVLLINGTQVQSTRIERAVSNRIFFDDELTCNLTSSTPLKIQIYSITMKDKPKFTPFRCKQKHYFKTQKIQYKNINTNDMVEDNVIQTSFSLCAETQFFPSDFRSNTFILRPSTDCKLQKNFSMSIRIENFRIEHNRNGFITLGKRINADYLNWNRQWCILQDFYLHIYDSPSDVDWRQPIFTIDLSKTVQDISIAPKFRCNRKNALFVNLGTTEYFLRFDKNDEMKSWLNDLNLILDLLRLWKII